MKATCIDGEIIEHQGGVIKMATPASVPVGAAIQLLSGDGLFLGEVRFCRSTGSGFTVALDIEQAVYDTAQLAKLAERILGEG